MFGTAVIVFREVLEAAIIIGIVAAATRNVPGRRRWLVGGVAAGLVGSAVVAFSTDVIAGMADGIGQEIFNAMVLGIAVLMLAWHNIWMTTHGAELAADARNVGKEISEGTRECSVLMMVVGLAVLREGSETVLFLYGIATSAQESSSAMALGAFLGMATGVAVGVGIFAGLLRVPMRWFFKVTGVMVLFLAAGMASSAAGYLIQADLLPSLATPLWDSSSWLPMHSITGMLLHSLMGYEAQPAGMQIVFYMGVMILIGTGMFWAASKNIQTKPSGI